MEFNFLKLVRETCFLFCFFLGVGVVLNETDHWFKSVPRLRGAGSELSPHWLVASENMEKLYSLLSFTGKGGFIPIRATTAPMLTTMLAIATSGSLATRQIQESTMDYWLQPIYM